MSAIVKVKSSKRPRTPGRFLDGETGLPQFLNQVLKAAKKGHRHAPASKRFPRYAEALTEYCKAAEYRADISRLNPDDWTAVPAQTLADNDSNWYAGPRAGAPAGETPPRSNVGSLACSTVYAVAFSANIHSGMREHDNSRKADAPKNRKIVRPGQVASVTWSLGEPVPFAEQSFPGLEERSNCTENRLLNGLAKAYPGAQFQGRVLIFTERFPCDSCRQVIGGFLGKHRDAHLHVVYTYDDDTVHGRQNESVQELLSAGADITQIRQLEMQTTSPLQSTSPAE